MAEPIYISANSLQGFLFSPHPYQYMVIFCFLNNIHPTDVRWNFTVVLICISLVISVVEHLFMYLLVISISLGKCLFMCFIQFLIRLLNSLLFELCEFLVYLDIYPLSYIFFVNILPILGCCLFCWWFTLPSRTFSVKWNLICLFLLLFPVHLV